MKELNLTQGSVPKVLLQFAVPFLIAVTLPFWLTLAIFLLEEE